MTFRHLFIGGVLATAVLLPLALHVNAGATPRRIGVLMTTTPVAAAHIVAAFAEGLRSLGYVEGENIAVEYRWAEGRPERFAPLAADLVERKVDVIVASSQGPALAAKRATATIPIVMVNTSDPVEVGLVASLARPGGNVTGLSQQLTPEIRAKQLQLLQDALPKVARVAVFHSAATTVALREYEAAGQALGLRVQFVGVPGANDLGEVFARLGRGRIDALLVPGDTLLFTERRRVAALALEHRLPGIYSLREFTEAGGLMSYSARLGEQFRRAAIYVDKILRGGRPATLPVEAPSEYELVINLKTAKALGLAIPQSLLLRADQIIE